MSEIIKGYKFGDSESLGDQALELAGAMNQLMQRYLDLLKEQLNVDDEDDDYIDDETKAMLDLIRESIILCDHAEKLVIGQCDAMDRMEHKLDKIMKKLDDLECR